LLGPSGSGKSSLLRLIAGLDQADGGRLAIEAVNGALRRGFCFSRTDVDALAHRAAQHHFALELEGWSRERCQSAR